MNKKQKIEEIKEIYRKEFSNKFNLTKIKDISPKGVFSEYGIVESNEFFSSDLLVSDVKIVLDEFAKEEILEFVQHPNNENKIMYKIKDTVDTLGDFQFSKEGILFVNNSNYFIKGKEGKPVSVHRNGVIGFEIENKSKGFKQLVSDVYRNLKEKKEGIVPWFRPINTGAHVEEHAIAKGLIGFDKDVIKIRNEYNNLLFRMGNTSKGLGDKEHVNNSINKKYRSQSPKEAYIMAALAVESINTHSNYRGKQYSLFANLNILNIMKMEDVPLAEEGIVNGLEHACESYHSNNNSEFQFYLGIVEIFNYVNKLGLENKFNFDHLNKSIAYANKKEYVEIANKLLAWKQDFTHKNDKFI